ncbi:PSP1 domain-containing protein [Poriferisphaera sp. WC338]|uniref:PSP1 domain-containing protein n=1 Tax=Poriferisphaera sp. WC338 TaxID=3425129 RepID=UPI003D816111
MAGSITPLPIMLEEEDRKAYEKLEAPKTIVVRYGYQKKIAELAYDGTAKPGCGSKVVIRTDRGTEIAEMLTTTCPNSGCAKSVTRKEMLSYIDRSGGKDFPFTSKGKVLRVATIEDMNEQSKLDNEKRGLIKKAHEHIAELDLEMKLIEVEPLLGAERVIFYYVAEDWVDFRELVKKLASEMQMRIEMCQVNARDEARIVADYEKCGQQCCCKQFLKVLKPVSMRSAKVQKATLDPQKISGRCGRLMCCLRYEDKTYSELKKNLPPRKSVVEVEDGIGIVLDSQILTQLSLVKIGVNPPAAYPIESLRILDKDEAKAWRDAEKERQEAAAASWQNRRRGGGRRDDGKKKEEKSLTDQVLDGSLKREKKEEGTRGETRGSGEKRSRSRRGGRSRRDDGGGYRGKDNQAKQQEGQVERNDAQVEGNKDGEGKGDNPAGYVSRVGQGKSRRRRGGRRGGKPRGEGERQGDSEAREGGDQAQGQAGSQGEGSEKKRRRRGGRRRRRGGGGEGGGGDGGGTPSSGGDAGSNE